MNKKQTTKIGKKISLVFFLLIWLHGNIYSETVESPRDQEKWNSIISQVLPEENQTRIRRGEIVFFLSLPFVLAAHILAGGIIGMGQSGSIKNISFPIEGVIFAGVSSVLVSSAITVHDSKRFFSSKREEEKIGGLDKQVRFSLVFRFR